MNRRGIRARPWLAHILLLLALATAACRFSGQTTPTPQGEIGFLPLTAVASITPPAPPRRSCMPVEEQVSLPKLDDGSESARRLLGYLNEGGDPVALADAEADLDLTKLDIDGDGWVDLAFILQDAAITAPQPTGSMLLCRAGSYELGYRSSSTPERSAPTVHSNDDLNGDGNDDLFISRDHCGAHTCTAELRLLLWIDGGIENRIEGETDDLPSPEIQVRSPGSGAATIAVTAHGVNSVGAGPFRPLTRVWTWDSDSGLFRPTREEPHSTNFRIHRLHDADSLALDGHSAEALELYERVIVDASLRDWVDPPREQRVLSAYARYRQITTSIQLEDREGAENYLRFLRSAVQPEDLGAPYLEVAEAFWSSYGATDSLAAACLSAQSYAAAHPEGVLDPLYFGYANPVYRPQDICPLTEDG